MAGNSKLPLDNLLLEIGSLDRFVQALNLYDKALHIKGSSKTNKKTNLSSLDRWYQRELPASLKSRGNLAHLTRDELVKLMQWKLARGKFRPRLVEFAASNSEELVKQCTSDGIKLVKKDINKALAVISKLKGVGPATASAVLAAAAPEHCCFFADEVAYAALGVTGGLKYSESEYSQLNTTLQRCAARLNAAQNMDEDERWTPHRVELALWSYSVLRQNKPELLLDKSAASEGSASKRKIDQQETADQKKPRK